MRSGALRQLRAALLSPARRRGEQGYVLGVVLVAMMIGLSLITALLGLSFTTQRAAVTQQELARERRAADGALEVAVEEIRSNYSPGVDLCDPAVVPSTVAMDLGGEAGDRVTLDCSHILDPTPNAAGDIKVVGEDSPSFQHSGGSALGVVGAITVRKGATFGGSADPALQVAGNYAQGDVCDPSAIPIEDAEGDPECDSNEAKALVADVSGVAPPPATATAIPDKVCPSDAVGRSFAPGRFGASQVAKLNWLFENCGGTFRFQPGSYWFDGTLDFKSPVAPLPATVVLIGNANENTMTCQPNASATKVVMAATATITHESGRVLLCGDLLQTSEVDDGPKLVNASSTRFDVPANALSESSLAVAEMSSPPNQLEATIVANGTRLIRGLALRWSSQEVPQSEFLASRGVWAEFFPPGSSVAACKTYTGSTPDFRGRVHYDSKIGSQLDLLGGTCGGVFAGQQEAFLNNWRLRVSFSQQFPTIAGWPVVLNYCNNTHACKQYVSNLHLVNQAHEVEAANAQSGGAAPWNDVVGLVGLGQNSSYVVNNCSLSHNGVNWNDYCTRTGSEPSSSFAISGFTLPADLSSGDKLTSTVVAFDVAPLHANDLLADPNNTAATAVQGSTTVTISYPDSDGDPATCAVSTRTYLRSRRTYTMDLTSCPDLSTAGQLEHAVVDVSLQPEKGAWLTTLDPNDNDEWVSSAGLELPTLDYVHLIATTNTVNDTVDLTVSVDEVSGNSFRVYGNTSLPRTNLKVAWNGTATTEALFNGQLTVRSVDSSQTGAEVGVLCCGPMSPTIRVNAYTDAPPGGSQPAVIRGTARIRLDPVAGGGSTVTVADWQLCHLDGCKLNDTLLPP